MRGEGREGGGEMKRVRKGYERHGEVRLYERGGSLCIEQLRNRIERHTIVLSATECEAIGITAALEDVPEPWQVLRRAVLNAAGTITSEPPGECIRITERGWREAAAALGIKPEVG